MLLGAHVSIAGGLETAIDRGLALGCESIQIFPQSPRVWKPAAHSPEALERLKQRQAETGLAIVCHAPYLINLAATDTEIVRKSVLVLEAAAATASAGGCEAIILHLGSHLGTGFDEGLTRAAPALREALAALDDTTWLLLENTAGSGNNMGRTLEELERVADRAAHPRLGVCLDSAHLYASGVDVTDRAVVEELLAELDRRFGLARLRALHINDSATELGSNRDRHANIGEGQMGDGLAAFLGHPQLQGLPAVLETAGHEGKGPDERCMAELRRLLTLGLALYG